MKSPKTKIFKFFAMTGLAIMLLVGISQPVYAQITVYDPTANINFLKQLAHDAAQVSQWYHDNIQSAISSVTARISDWLRANLEVKIMDVKSVNDRNTSNSNAVATALAPLIDPKNRDACQIHSAAQAAITNNANALAMGGAMTRAGMNRQNTPAAAAQEAKNQMSDGLAPCSNSLEPDSQNYQKLGCQTKWGGAYEGADLTPEALFGGENGDAGSLDGLPVPKEFKNNLSTNVAQPIPVVSDRKYMPFVAAYNFCQKINPKRSQIPASAQATVGTLQVLDKNNTDTMRNSAYEMCMYLLAERMQYGAELTDPVFQQYHKDQFRECNADHNKNWLDDAPGLSGLSTYSKCDTDGRSKLQAMYDHAFRDQYAVYQQNYLDGASLDVKYLLDSALEASHLQFHAYVLQERQALLAAIAATNSSPVGPQGSTLNNSAK